MIHFALAALLALQQPFADAPDFKHMASDFAALKAANSDLILEPLTTCVGARFDAYTVPAGEKGDGEAAMRFVQSQALECGLEGARSRLISALAETDKAADRTTLERRADAALGLSLLTAVMRAMKDFGIEAPPGPPLKVYVPCPAELKRVPDHPCFGGAKD